MEVFGHKRGSLKKAARQAFKKWEREVEKKEFSEEILEDWKGKLSHVDETSLEAEKKAFEARAENALD